MVLPLAKGWTVQGSNPSRGETFRTRPYRARGPQSHFYDGHRLKLGDKAAGSWRYPPISYSAEDKERVELYF